MSFPRFSKRRTPKRIALIEYAYTTFFEAVSEVDGVISQSEKEYLMTLLHLDDDDVSNDIDIETSISLK